MLTSRRPPSPSPPGRSAPPDSAAPAITTAAIGGWLAAVLYDYFSFYAPAFAAGVAANAVNLLIIGTLVLRRKYVPLRLA